MYTMNDSELSILNASVAQVTHFITAAHQTRNAHLVRKHVKMLADAPPPPGTPSTTDLNAILNNVVAAPGTTSIAAVPKQIDPLMFQMLSQVQTLDSYISLLTAFCIYNEHPTPYDIADPKQANAFARVTAKWRNYVVTGGVVKAITAYVPVGSIIPLSFNQVVAAADLHLAFLTDIFKGFAFPETSMTELDSILTKVVSRLGNLQMSFETQDETLDHFLTYYYFSTVPGTGGANQPPAMYAPKLRTFFFHIDQSSWKAAVAKSSVNMITFHMNYYDMDTTMNPNAVANDMTAINSTIQKLSGRTEAEVTKLMNMQAIHADPQKA